MENKEDLTYKVSKRQEGGNKIEATFRLNR